MSTLTKTIASVLMWISLIFPIPFRVLCHWCYSVVSILIKKNFLQFFELPFIFFVSYYFFPSLRYFFFAMSFEWRWFAFFSFTNKFVLFLFAFSCVVRQRDVKNCCVYTWSIVRKKWQSIMSTKKNIKNTRANLIRTKASTLCLTLRKIRKRMR